MTAPAGATPFASGATVGGAPDRASIGRRAPRGPWRPSLSTQSLALLAIGILILAATLVTMGVELLHQRDASAKAVAARNVQVASLNLQIAMVDQETGLRGYAETGQAAFLDPYLMGQSSMQTTLRSLTAGAAGTDLEPLVADVRRTAVAWAAWAQAQRAAIDRNGPGMDVTAALEDKSLFDAYRAAQGRLTRRAEAEVATAIAVGRASRDRSVRALLVGGPSLLVMLLALAAILTLATLRPIGRLAVAAERMAAGQDPPVPGIARADEVGSLARALQRWQAAEWTERRRAADERLAAKALREASAAPDAPAALGELVAVCSEFMELDAASFSQRMGGDRSLSEIASWPPDGGSRPRPAGDDQTWSALRQGRAVVLPAAHREGEEPSGSWISIPLLAAGDVRARIDVRTTAAPDAARLAAPLVQALVSTAAPALDGLVALQRERELSERLRRLDEQKTEFLGAVAHDLRSPMTMIIGYATLLQRRWPELAGERRQQLLDTIVDTAYRLAALARDSLDVARIESGEMRYDLRPFDLAALLRRTAEESIAAFPGRVAVVEAGDHLPMAFGDEDRWWQILTNLLSNALKFSDAGTEVRARVVLEDDRLRISVSDQGAGIEPADMPKLFGKFSRIDRGGTVPGTGLGLYLCRAMAEAQGGRIWAESSPGIGSTFVCTLATHREPP